MLRQRQLVIFTDLDGALLDHHSYRPDEALPALEAAQARGAPVIFCSSKTRAEIEAIQSETRVCAPFIVENGGAVYIPANTFPFAIEGGRTRNGYDVIELGTPYPQLVAAMRLLRSQIPYRLVGFSDLTITEVALECGLGMEAAARAKAREYDEPFRLLNHEQANGADLLWRIKNAGLRCSVGGRFWHLHGDNDKGLAVKLLADLYSRMCGEIFTIALGDSENDLPMLQVADLPVVTRRPDGSLAASLINSLPNARWTQAIGPRGWAEAVTRILREQKGIE